ncbi:MAG TPA: transposase [Sphaerochaeta sp.]|nr:transposase [Sphaerochaeta sp.]
MRTRAKMLALRTARNSYELKKAHKTLKEDLAIAFPEILAYDVTSLEVLTFLSRFGSAGEVLSASDRQLVRPLRISPNETLRLSIVERIKSLAATSTGSGSYAPLVCDSALHILACMEREERLDRAFLNMVRQMFPKELEILTSIDGIQEADAASFMAEVDDIHRFPSSKSLVSYLGILPPKSGNALLRQYVFQMTEGCIRVNPTFRAYYHKKRKEGAIHLQAMTTTMHKLIRTIHAMLIQEELFVPKE